ncbi:class I SAM-dependent RNA methyltransferase [Fulvivirgaceae bacterium PWU5]|uniref:Class I SAM-dependent RNA methyltransferase n=1 Tax=Dawidia cretensis TaxID=2782350 RepID=A0AAP2GWP7_9BACT|nr:class I SAM-dependent RNA methyltransferase [Dawidia cretensis]MBT1711087.1 class I SAM-dependent RNA methyltransferase [Dawidia cretensis]
MNVFQESRRIIITCNKRLSPYLEKEVRDLGFEPERVFQTGVELLGTVRDCIRLNLNLRCASQILYSLHEFRVNSPQELYDVVFKFPWEDIMAGEGYFSVTSNVDHFTINTPLFANVKVKDAIADRFRRNTARRPNSGPDLDQTVVHLYWKEDRGELFADTSGYTLAKHGYRKVPGKAPMLEALAAATLMAGKWDRQSPFVNPMCGSGTLAIEAALLATDRRPGLYRDNYAFMHLLGYEESFYREEREQLDARVHDVPGLQIIASDISDDAVNVAQSNAGMAGVANLIRFERGDFAKTTVPPAPGVVYFNPEYGERLGEVQALEETYGRVGDFLKQQCKGYTGYIFTGNLDLAKKIGLRASRRIEFYTAKLDCRLLEYELYAGTRQKKQSESESESGV